MFIIKRGGPEQTQTQEARFIPDWIKYEDFSILALTEF